MAYETRLASLASYEKGGVEVIDDDPKNYAFSNIFDVASGAKPFEHIVVAQNFEYTLEVVRVEGTSSWRACSHDQTALVMDGEVHFRFQTLGGPMQLPDNGSIALGGEPSGSPMGRVLARWGHLTLLPAGRAYQYSAVRPSVLLVQTVDGADSRHRWAQICQTV